jgi:hypothetical protein
LRSEIIADGILEPFANPLLGDGIQVAFAQNGVNDLRVLVAQLGRYYCARSEKDEQIGESRSLKPEADRGNIRDMLPVDRSISSVEWRRVLIEMRIGHET